MRGDLPAGAAAPLIAAVGLTKQYPGVLALDHVDFELKAGEVHILFGENGAGKSTLIAILSGATRPTAGEIRFEGTPIHLDSVQQAREIGIAAVFQEFSLVPQMTVEENIFLGAETTRGGFLDRRSLRRRAVRDHQAARLPAEADGPGAQSQPRRAADGGDHQGVPLEAARADPRRADRLADGAGDGAALPPHRRRSKARASASSTSRIACRRSSGSATASPCCATGAMWRRAMRAASAATSWCG